MIMEEMGISSNALTMTVQVSKTHMGNTMRLGCRRTFFRKPDCLTSKLYGHSILSWLIIFSLALLNLVCLESQPIDTTIKKLICHTVVLSVAFCTWMFMILLHCISKCGFCLVKFWCKPLVIDHLQELPYIKVLCTF